MLLLLNLYDMKMKAFYRKKKMIVQNSIDKIRQKYSYQYLSYFGFSRPFRFSSFFYQSENNESHYGLAKS